LVVKVVLKFVFNNQGLTNDLVNQLVRLVENQKIRYLTGRQLGRVILRENVINKTKTLVNHDLINKNGLYREDTRKKVKELILNQLRGEGFKKMAKDTIVNYFKTSGCQELFTFTLDENLVKEWIIKLFEDKCLDKAHKILLDKQGAQTMSIDMINSLKPAK